MQTAAVDQLVGDTTGARERPPNGACSSPSTLARSRHAGDPKRLVLNLRFTGDPAVHEPAIREVWGGALCLSRARHTVAELRALQERAQKEIKGMYSASADERAGHVGLGVWVATPELQHQVDEKYGRGLVVLEGFLTPAGS